MKPDADTHARPSPAAGPRGASERSPLAPAPHSQALFLDVDGTLLPIAPHPDDVKVAPDLLDLLGAIEGRTGGALALVSGRAIANLDALFAPLRLPSAGVHGLERRSADGSLHRSTAAEALAPLRQRLKDYVASREGLLLEDKDASLALHYRAAPRREAEARDFLQSLVADAPALELTNGKMVFEVKPGAADKGTAIQDFMAEPPFAGRQPVFVGDDVTDEDGFGAVNALGGQSIRVGPLEGSAARHSLADEAAVHTWLRGWLDAT